MTGDFMQVADRVISAYSTHELRPLTRAVVAAAGIEESDAEFLCEIGLPRIEQMNISFNLADTLPTLDELISSRKFKVSGSLLQVRCLNEKYDNIIGVDITTGTVLWLDLTERIPNCFVNSRVRYLVGFMAECVLHWKRWTQKGIPQKSSF